MKKQTLFSILLFISTIFCGCKEDLGYKPNLSFYYWKQNFKISPPESQKLKDLKVNKIYIRLFDIAYNYKTGGLVPKAELKVSDTINWNKYEVIPCIYIENSVFFNVKDRGVDTLVAKVLSKVSHLIGERFKEIHIDCDWTKGTKESYFYFIKKLSQISQKEISSTIRLHQIKYKINTGVPPVKKGVLMCYNMGKIQEFNEVNSIFDLGLLKNYTKNIENYPLKLDIALPIFSWNVVFRDKKFLFISSEDMSLEQSSKFEHTNDNFYKCISSTRLSHKPVLRGDLVRKEEALQEELIEAIDWFSEKLNKPNFIFYHLNKNNIEAYEKVFNYCFDI